MLGSGILREGEASYVEQIHELQRKTHKLQARSQLEAERKSRNVSSPEQSVHVGTFVGVIPPFPQRLN